MELSLQKYAVFLYDKSVELAPKLIAALVILIVAYIIAKLIGRGIRMLIDRTGVGKKAAASGESLGQSIGNAVFWVVMLIAMPMVLGQLGLTSILAPLEEMTAKFLGFLPNLFGGGLIFFVGWIVATVVRKALESILRAAQVDNLASRAGLADLTGETGISRFVGILAFTLIIIPVAIAALDTLQLAVIAGPAKEMLSSLLNAIPNIFAAGMVLLLTYVISRFAGSTVTGLLPATGIDKVSQNSIMGEFIGKNRKVSDLAGKLTSVAIMLFGLIEAAKLLNFSILSNAMNQILGLGASILLGTVIIAFGVFAANIVGNVVSNVVGSKKSPMPGLVKTVIIILASAMGLRQMGVGDEIVTMGFSLMLGAVALGSAIAIGFGGQEAAKKLLTKWTSNL